MVEHLWTVLCSRSLVDVESQNISLLEVIDEISVAPEALTDPQGITLPLRMELITCWRRSNLAQGTKTRAKMTLVHPDGRTLEEQSYSVDLSESTRRRTRFRIPGITVTKAGTYWFRMEVQTVGNGPWIKVAQLPLDIVVAPPKTSP